MDRKERGEMTHSEGPRLEFNPGRCKGLRLHGVQPEVAPAVCMPVCVEDVVVDILK